MGNEWCGNMFLGVVKRLFLTGHLWGPARTPKNNKKGGNRKPMRNLGNFKYVYGVYRSPETLGEKQYQELNIREVVGLIEKRIEKGLIINLGNTI